ncbi:hypothetical protein RZA67_02620 [Stenotrophomonas sp. C3(2023)]|uniref:hypothetical protein n=1 Tax=Stenotrophomonas sp. C3(2023) TaxID=3080277 RepID=UPI00293C19BF|nr:hypothetical protein [Stenotrophomonas sp. C3(2023)]MDV3467636.1 hypothetical protein [Stenotrophomonas sp. C3(2023)]
MTHRMLPLYSLMLLAACQPAPSAPPHATADAATAAPVASIRWDKRITWDGDINACRQGQPSVQCLQDAMRGGGASPAAIAAAGELSVNGELAYVSAWHEHDGIGVATVTYPFRANTNQGTLLVDSAGRRIDVDAIPTQDNGAQDPVAQAVLQSHPGAMPFAPAQAAGTAALEQSGVRLLYRTPLRQCHACADVGQLQVAYDFDDKRVFRDRQAIAP